VAGWFGDNTAERFEAYGWHVLPHVDGQSSDAVAAALAAARAETGRPSLICAKTTIGWGAPNKTGHGFHARRSLWATKRLPPPASAWGGPSPPFEIPADIRAAWDMRRQGRTRGTGMAHAFCGVQKPNSPRWPPSWSGRMEGDLPGGFADLVNAYVARTQAEGKALATRQSSQAALNALGSLAAGTVRRVGGSHAVERHLAQGFGDADRGFARRQLRAFRRPRVRHVGDV